MQKISTWYVVYYIHALDIYICIIIVKVLKILFEKKKKKKSLPTYSYPHLAGRVGFGETNNILILAWW